MLGVKVVIAESYERIHRSNLIGMGILPLQFLAGDTVTNLQLTGNEVFSIDLSDAITSREIHVSAAAKDGSTIRFRTISRVDTAIEAQYYRDGGILRTVLKKLLQTATT